MTRDRVGFAFAGAGGQVGGVFCSADRSPPVLRLVTGAAAHLDERLLQRLRRRAPSINSLATSGHRWPARPSYQ